MDYNSNHSTNGISEIVEHRYVVIGQHDGLVGEALSREVGDRASQLQAVGDLTLETGLGDAFQFTEQLRHLRWGDVGVQRLKKCGNGHEDTRVCVCVQSRGVCVCVIQRCVCVCNPEVCRKVILECGDIEIN